MNRKNTLGTLIMGTVAGLIGCASTSELEAKAQTVASIKRPPVEADGRIYSSRTGRVVIASINKATEQEHFYFPPTTEQQYLSLTEQADLQVTMSEKNNPDKLVMEMHDYKIDGTCDVGRFYGDEDNTPLYYSRLSETGMENEQFFQREYEKTLDYMLAFARRR